MATQETQTQQTNDVPHHQQVRTLSDRDRDLFLALLDSDEEPSEALKNAAEDYKLYTVSGLMTDNPSS
jgi:uncharacterized protein (DUF1778 family)